MLKSKKFNIQYSVYTDCNYGKNTDKLNDYLASTSNKSSCDTNSNIVQKNYLYHNNRYMNYSTVEPGNCGTDPNGTDPNGTGLLGSNQDIKFQYLC